MGHSPERESAGLAQGGTKCLVGCDIVEDNEEEAEAQEGKVAKRSRLLGTQLGELGALRAQVGNDAAKPVEPAKIRRIRDVEVEPHHHVEQPRNHLPIVHCAVVVQADCHTLDCSTAQLNPVPV